MTAVASQQSLPEGSVPSRAWPAHDDVLAHAAGENFPVALRLLPRADRAGLLAVYGFARLTDDLGDQWPGDRMEALDWLEAELDAALAGRAAHPTVTAAARTILALGIDDQPLRDLIEANRQDQVVHAYRSFEALVGYCRLSANPVGRLVLAIFGASTPQHEEWSDAICTGLQLAEHWQDVGEDAAAGRIYLPAEDRDRFGVDPAELLGRTSSPATAGPDGVPGRPGPGLAGHGHAVGGRPAGPLPPGGRRLRRRRPRRPRRHRRAPTSTSSPPPVDPRRSLSDVGWSASARTHGGPRGR